MADSRQLLFGGAIVAPIKSSFVDASLFREVPSNQEVFVDTHTQQSLIIELLEQADAEADEVAKFHFAQLASDNDAISFSIQSVQTCLPQNVSPLLPAETTSVYVLHGSQQVAKFNEGKDGAYNHVHIVMAVIRLARVKTDIVISINAPQAVAEKSSEKASSAETIGVSLELVDEEMMGLLNNFEVKDWTLFV
ncbi:Ran GTPase binding protein [Phycomyces blakesleeanus]|uniref:Ran guanine nucleotide release factor n=2 Tax=Phycomyces blakesleeanus TaxID=4837 RepID=A0A162PSD3_PHYB8|nr:hypothetical protein PHYBLDRAFT_143789 [Phycomyces blakesleeanus NRRL 1555(-)]OAD75537.1 hypothetical protein PHYBLDRAFT_143789 [Phycomyces blakesleeanus NRRL 1555(-)]|eukprot:XP_018293577.1 hypothetical protein PHYBLDRAFT_143789 [Phycomyces blakesleeanus NRRL 1555(-)]